MSRLNCLHGQSLPGDGDLRTGSGSIVGAQVQWTTGLTVPIGITDAKNAEPAFANSAFSSLLFRWGGFARDIPLPRRRRNVANVVGRAQSAHMLGQLNCIGGNRKAGALGTPT